MSSEIFSKSWADWSDSDDESDGKLKIDCGDEDVDMKNVNEEAKSDSCENIKVIQSDPVKKTSCRSPHKSKSKKSSSKSEDKIIKEEPSIVISTDNFISKHIKEKSVKVEEHPASMKQAKEGPIDANDDIDDLYLFMKESSDDKSKKPEKDSVKVTKTKSKKHTIDEPIDANNDLDDMYLFMNQPSDVESNKSKKDSSKVKKTITKESKTSVDVEGAEDEWALLAGPVEESPAPKRLSFAEICAKNALPAPVQTSVVKSEGSPTKKQRKRSLFPEEDRDRKKDVFGVLDENSIDSPSKDIRRIMNRIRMDSPLKSDSLNTEKPRTRSKVVPLKLELMDEPSKPLSPRKRARDPVKTNESPAPKVRHYSGYKDRDSKADSPAPKVRHYSGYKDRDSNAHSPARKNKGYESDNLTLIRRQKQIDFGKNTKGYDNYVTMVPKDKREALHPKTPPKHLVYSRRAWDGLIKVWRQKLHFWDSPADGGSGGIGALPDSWDTLSEASLASISDDTSEKSLPCTPQESRRRTRRSTRESASSRD